MPTIRLSETAERDLEAIWDYTVATWGKNQASRYLAQMEKSFHDLLENPYMGVARPDIKMGYRSLRSCRKTSSL